jgi:hypothetical protein
MDKLLVPDELWALVEPILPEKVVRSTPFFTAWIALVTRLGAPITTTARLSVAAGPFCSPLPQKY